MRSNKIFKSSPTPPLTDSALQQTIQSAEHIIPRWSYSENSDHCATNRLFSADDSRENANEFISAVHNLQEAIKFLQSGSSSSKTLLRCQQLVRIAIKRLTRELEFILVTHQDFKIDPDYDRVSESDSDVAFELGVAFVKKAATVQAMNDLKSIADCMTDCGYGKECAKLFTSARKSVVEDELHRLGIDRLSLNIPIHKLDWGETEDKIKNWLSSMRIAVKSIFYGERILCDIVFLFSPQTRELCFSAIARDNALSIFQFPEQVASKIKKSPEKLFRFLDLYEAISKASPEINYIFSSDSSASVRSQAELSLVKLAEASRAMLVEFETAIHKDSCKTLVPGGGVHRITSYVMNYLIFLSDYTFVLEDILASWKLNLHAPLPEEYFGSRDNKSNVALRFIWIVLGLLSNLDVKANRYKEIALSYLFLANNLCYVVNKVRSSALDRIFGEDWATKHDEKVRHYAASYERMGWRKVMGSLSNEDCLERAKERFRRFNGEFVEVQRKHVEWVVVDGRLREEMKDSLARNIVPKYREMYNRWRDELTSGKGSLGPAVVRYAPEDLENYLWGLLFGCSDGDSSARSTRGSTASSCSSSNSSTCGSPSCIRKAR